jgi:hypothetical protein
MNMKSTFFHVGVNRKMARKEGLQEPQVDPKDGSIPHVPVPTHRDPDFENLTYGDPWGRLNNFHEGDIAWFIETGTVSKSDCGYYLVAYFVIEDKYFKRLGAWNKNPNSTHAKRIAKNAHEIRGDDDYAIILGAADSSRLLFANPLRISKGQDAFDNIKNILGLPKKPTRGYWFKKWFDDDLTNNLLRICSRRQR